MKKQYFFKQNLFIIAILFIQLGYSQVTISSLAQLKTYITQDNVDAVMVPGTYIIDSDITGTNNLLPDPIMFEFTGSNSTYDFTDVKFEFNTEILNDYGNVEVVEIRIYGNNNVLQGLTMADIGTDAPRNRARAIHLDGLNNKIENFHITVQGSYPYGYGDLFGKGGGSVIGHRKHSGILVRGDGNHIKDCTVIHRSYGHGIFIQGGKNVLIEGVYMEGDDLRTTDDVLLEEGTGSAADNVDFLTVWGYTVPAGYMFSKHEDGIRTYASAGLYTNDKTGDETVSYTENITIKDCTIKKMRSGYSFAFGTGDFLIDNCISLECESGFGVISGGVISNCSADAKYGMVYANAYESNKNITADITVLNSENGYGPHHIAYIGGSNNNITLRSDDGSLLEGKSIQVSGEKNSMRMLNGTNASQTRHDSSSNTINNFGGYPVILDEGTTTISSETYLWEASDNIIKICNEDVIITDKGSNNVINLVDCNSTNLALKGTASQSTTDYDGLASRAIDGNTDGNFSNESVSHTANIDDDRWWQVDLGQDKKISNIVIYNRTGKTSYSERLNNYTVHVINTNGDVVFSKLEEDYPNPSINISTGDNGVIGSIVKISKTSDEPITLAEVQVIGSDLDNLSAPQNMINNINLSPNPVTDGYLNISLQNTNFDIQKTSIKLYNLAGIKLLETSNINKLYNTTLDVSGISNGVYIIKISDDHNFAIKKIIKI